MSTLRHGISFKHYVAGIAIMIAGIAQAALFVAESLSLSLSLGLQDGVAAFPLFC